MKDFIKPTKKIISKIDLEKIDSFISIFNSAIRKNNFSLNTGLDKIPYLNEGELKMAQERANKNGYTLSVHEDNYQTETYVMTYKELEK